MSNVKMEAQFNALLAATEMLDCPPDQKRELRRMFYAGAASFAAETFEILAPGSEVSDVEVLKYHELLSEVLEFNQKVQRGEA